MNAEEKNGSNIVSDILSYPYETKNRFNDSNIFSPIWQPEPVSEQTTGMLLAANGLAALSCQSQSDGVWMSLPYNLHFDYL